ncbi:hypothetical protein BGX31_009340 [Mortierella sp. GBA43]|nr:hypothetical protein BGX31_009340 [Mortierella sp. GBA43]
MDSQPYRVKIQDYDRLMRRLSTMVRMDSTVDTDSTPIVSEGQQKQGIGTFTLPPHIFAENLCPTPIVKRLPDPDEPLTSIPQLVCCLELLNESRSLDDILEPAARAWLQLVEDDEEEQERLRSLSNEVIKTFKSETKDANAVAEIVCLAPVLERDTFRDLLREFYNGIEHSALLDFHLVEGLAQMIQGANPGYLYTDDLIRILGLLSKRLQETHRKSPKHMYDLMLAASSVLDAMADTHVEGLDRETLHEPLLLYLGSLRDITDPFLIYQVAYAFQALLRVPDNETPWQATIRRTGKVVRGVSGLVRAVKGFDLVGLVDGLKEVQKGLAGASDVFKTAVAVFGGLNSLTEGGHDFLEGLKEGFSFRRRCAWYPALRGADAAIRDGDFIAFKQLIYDAPCRLDQAFQWGLCQRLGEIALNSSWNARTRRSAIDFLREIYRNNNDWGDRKGIKEWIVTILVSLKEASSQCKSDFWQAGSCVHYNKECEPCW